MTLERQDAMHKLVTMSGQMAGNPLTVTPSTPVIGAEITGVDLRRPLSSGTVAELRELLARYKVLFFRDHELDTAQQVLFARNFGSILLFSGVQDDHPQYPGVKIVDGSTTLPRSDGGRETGFWHIDSSDLIMAPFATILRAVTLPSVGGDTVWTNLAGAYEGLPDDLKKIIDGLYVTHGSVSYSREHRSDYPLLSHPLVRNHPETHEKVLFINFMFHPWVVGWSPEKSDELIQRLKEEVTRPEYQVRFRWSHGAIAMWDNRAVLHYAVNDYDNSPRRMERILVAEPLQNLIEQLG